MMNVEKRMEQWRASDPMTLTSELDGQMVCPSVWKLPCGDLLVGSPIDGDFPLTRTQMIRSSDGGTSWREDDLYNEFLPRQSLLVLRNGIVRMRGEAVNVKDGAPNEYLFFYCDSDDGGRTFGALQTARFTVPASEMQHQPLPIGRGWGLQDRVIYRRAVLEAAGWQQPEFLEARLIGPPGGSHRSYLELADDKLLCFTSACTNPQKTDPNHWEYSLLANLSRDGGLTWEPYSVVAPYDPHTFPFPGARHIDRLPPWERGYHEGCARRLADGRLYIVMRSGGGGRELTHSWSADEGRTWTPVTPIDRRVCGVAPTLLKLNDGSLALCHGRPGMYVMFDPSGTGEHWQVDDRIDLTDGEMLTLTTNVRPFVRRLNCLKISDHVNVPLSAVDWAKPEVMSAYYYSWENVDMCEFEPGRLFVVYDLQNWIEKPGMPHRNALRGVWIEAR